MLHVSECHYIGSSASLVLSCSPCCREAIAAAMQRHDMMQCPPLASLNVSKNWENRWDLEDDGPGVTRNIVRLTQFPAVLVSSNDASLKNANLWSTYSPNHVLGYLLHHATTSGWHKLQLTDAYDQLVMSWSELKWEYQEETFQDRMAYRASLDVNQRLSAKRQLDEEHDGHGDSSEVPSKAGRYKDDEVFSDTFQSWVGPAGVRWYLWQGIDPKNSPEQWVGWHRDGKLWWYTYGDKQSAPDTDDAAAPSTA